MANFGSVGLDEEMRRLAIYCLDLDMRMDAAVAHFEKALLAERIGRAHNNQCAAADEEGIHRNTLKRRMVALGLEAPTSNGNQARRRVANRT